MVSWGIRPGGTHAAGNSLLHHAGSVTLPTGCIAVGRCEWIHEMGSTLFPEVH